MALLLTSESVRRHAFTLGEHPATAPAVTAVTAVATAAIIPQFEKSKMLAVTLVGAGGAFAFWRATKDRITPAVGIGVMTGAFIALIRHPKPARSLPAPASPERRSSFFLWPARRH